MSPLSGIICKHWTGKRVPVQGEGRGRSRKKKKLFKGKESEKKHDLTRRAGDRGEMHTRRVIQVMEFLFGQGLLLGTSRG